MSNDALEKAKELDEEHRIVERAMDFLKFSFNAIKDFVQHHNLIERGVNGIGRACYWAANKINSKLTTLSTNTIPASQEASRP